ncbi:MAG: redox-sensing transcriptional repressor Rex [Candidatus Omnitrophica bacterium]|jgi:redox-sensing transcriptional repressor|nr:redox-sensing transcriptional repressor Rex [Candidatus Omnitrophota bacterium]
MSKTKRNIPQDTASRLSLYLRSLRMLGKKRVDVASSEEITRFLNVTPVQFRKDLSYFGGFGKRGVGYDVARLTREIERILGTDAAWKIAIVGAGKLGSALLGYSGFHELNLQIVAAFDSSPERIGKVRQGVRIESTSRMKDILRKKGIRIAVLAVPADFAQKVGEELVRCGVKAVLNFAPVNLVLPEGVSVSNVDMASELESLIYKLKGERA